MDPRREHELILTRRQLFSRTATGIGTAALASLLEPSLFAQETTKRGILGAPHHRPTARRVIYLFMAGAPSQIAVIGGGSTRIRCSPTVNKWPLKLSCFSSENHDHSQILGSKAFITRRWFLVKTLWSFPVRKIRREGLRYHLHGR